MKIPKEVISDAWDAVHAVPLHDADNRLLAVIEVAARWALKEAARIADSDVLPFSLGGDHILDRATGMTIAEAIRKLAGDEP